MHAHGSSAYDKVKTFSLAHADSCIVCCANGPQFYEWQSGAERSAPERRYQAFQRNQMGGLEEVILCSSSKLSRVLEAFGRAS